MLAAALSTNFATLDWIIVAVYLLVSLGLGIVAMRYVGRLKDFLVAGRQLRIYLLIATMTGTELGLITVMYNAEQGYKRGICAFHIGLVQFLCYLAIGLTGFIIYRLREMGVMTVPEFYRRRYNKPVQVTGAVILLLGGVLNFGLFLQVGAQFLSGVTGLYSPMAFKSIMTGMLLLVLAYTALGGMVSVVLTDYVQFVVLSLALGVVSVMTLVEVNGWTEMVATVSAVKGEAFANPLVHQDYGISYILWMTLVHLSAACMWMPSVMRAMGAKTPAAAKKMYAWTSISFLARCVLPMLWGACACAFFIQLGVPGPAKGKEIMALPMFLGYVIPTGVLGVIVAGMLAAFMSTHDSYLLGWSAVVTQDVLAPLRGDRLSDASRIKATRITILALGAFIMGWGLWYEPPSTVWDYMGITGSIFFAGALPVVVGGLYWKRSSAVGAMASLLGGLVCLLGLIPRAKVFGEGVTGGLAQWWDKKVIGLSTFVLCGVLMVVFSLVFPDRPGRQERDALPQEGVDR